MTIGIQGSGRRRLAELRAERERESLSDEMSRSRSATLINLVIEIASGFLLLIGVYYILRFCRMQRNEVEPLLYNILIGTIAVFIFGWLLFFIFRLRRHLHRLRSLSGPHPRNDSGR